jgi:hypothetical protein
MLGISLFFQIHYGTLLDFILMVWAIISFPTSYTLISSSARQVSYENEKK